MQINATPDLNIVGGKAFYLSKLKEICAVPPFFVLSFSDPDEIKDLTVQKLIQDFWEKSGFSVAAVRSSASVEDSPATSFAGMFETILGVTKATLIESTEKVLRSLKSERVTSYCSAHGISPESAHMSVIIQRLVASRVSGVCFTKIQDANNTLMVEACLGLGEALVSGKVTPDTYTLDRDTLSIENLKIGYQSTFLQLDSGGASSYSQVPFFRRNAKKLIDTEIFHVAKTSLIIEDRLGLSPADVEWAFEGDSLFVVQARRFTGVPLK